MNNLVIASNEADAEAVAAVEQHHAELAGALAGHVQRLLTAAARGDQEAAWQSREQLVAWCRSDLVPHAAAEEQTLYPAARRREEGRLLVEAMLAEHTVLTGLVEEIDGTTQPVRAAASAAALRVVFDSHLAKENELLLPLLVGASDVSLAELLADMHGLLGPEETAANHSQSGCGGHSCACGEVDGPGYPELDARVVPHAIRHATIFGALDSVQPDGGMVLVAPHDPLPMLAQLEARSPGVFSVEYLERGPEAWRIQFVRRTA